MIEWLTLLAFYTLLFREPSSESTISSGLDGQSGSAGTANV